MGESFRVEHIDKYTYTLLIYLEAELQLLSSHVLICFSQVLVISPID